MNYQDIIEQIEDATENREQSFIDNIDSFVRRAEQRIYRVARLPASRQRSTSVSTVSGTAAYSWPDDFLLPLSVSAATGGVRTALLIKDVSYIQAAYPDASATGSPAVYANLSATQFLIGPTPDGVYSVQIDYIGFPASIVDEGTSWLGDNAEEALFYGAMVQALKYMKAPQEDIDAADKTFLEAVAMLKADADAADDDEHVGSTVV